MALRDEREYGGIRKMKESTKSVKRGKNQGKERRYERRTEMLSNLLIK